jgi:hypothetical protein
MKVLFFVSLILLGIGELHAQKAEVEVHHVEFKCRNCSNTGVSQHVTRVIRVIEGEQKDFETQMRWFPGLYFERPKKPCNNTNYHSCEFEEGLKKDCILVLDYQGVNFSPINGSSPMTQLSLKLDIASMITNCD